MNTTEIADAALALAQVQLNMTEEELRVDLAAAFRLAARENLHEGIANHFSVMLPDNEHFLLNPFGLAFEEVTASSLIVLNLHGEVVRGNALSSTASAAARNIHAPMHRHLPHARAILHTHQPYSTALTMVEGGRLEFALQATCRFFGRVAYDTDYSGVALDEDTAMRVVRTVGQAEVLFLGNHGVVTIAPTIAQAWDDLYFLERAAMTQIHAMATGRPLYLLSEQIISQTTTQAAYERFVLGYIAKHFASGKRLLDRHGSDHRS